MKYLFTSIVLGSMIAFFACDRNEEFITDGSATLEFSVDTLRFDTVFTELGSATRLVKIYNRNNRPVRIDRIFIEGRENSFFRMNVDGVAGDEARNVEIWANDSIYIFAEVTVDPDQPLSVSPFVIEDRIVLETNDKIQSVLLEAWGQNANYFPSRFNKGVPVVVSCNNGVVKWDDPKPYVIYGEVFIDSCLLEIAAGARVFVHGGIARNDLFGVFNDGIIYTLENGSLQVKGTKENPVIIQGDRLEESFQDIDGQWQGIIFGKGSRNNVIEYATIKNAIFSIYADSMSEVSIRNSRLFNTSSSAVIGFHSRITAENCLVYNNGSTSVQLVHGGDYKFTYCTVASYGVDASAVSMSNFFCYDDPFFCEVRKDYRLNATFQNCIFFGSRADEIQLSDITGGQTPAMFNIGFKDCIVRVDKLLQQQNGLYAGFFEKECTPCINATRQAPLFVNPNEDDYYLDSLSIAIGIATPIPGIDIDLDGKPRDSEPDIGCFERE
jgi:hypothetical protein